MILRVAVVGSGPAGLYTAEALIKQAANYADWLGIDKRERELAAGLRRGERVKLCGWDALNAACGSSRKAGEHALG